MDDLIDDVLTAARSGEPVEETEAVALADLAQECWTTTEKADASLVVETDLTVRADPGRLHQLLANLFRNAVEHGSTGNRTGSDDAVEHGGDGVTITAGDCEGGFFVADDGPGIPEDRREDVFDRGFTTADDGTGFGLSIVEEAAKAHGWTVDVTESANGGARFEVTGVETE
jgi:signal transduction histidine kinase